MRTSRLQYIRRNSEPADGPPVDWDEVDEELSRVNPAFRDPRFDSLKHVLTVLSSENAEAEVEELREQRAHIEELVDAVVEGYHAGFNKSIHNYSQILRLFTESKLQLESLRHSLESAKRRLSSQSRHMSQQWQRHITLSDTLRLLDDIQLVADVPQKLQRLEDNKEWGAAVALLLDGCNKLARQELSGVGALVELKEELWRRRCSLQASILAELESRMYRLQEPAAGAVSAPAPGCAAAGAAGPGPGTPVAGLQLPARHQRSSSSGGGSSMADGGLAGTPGALGAAAADGATLPSAQLPRRPLHRRAHTGGGGVLGAGGVLLGGLDGHLIAGDPQVPTSTLVDCLAQIGSIPDAQSALRKHMPQRLRGALVRALELFPASRHLPFDERYHQAGALLASPRSPRQTGSGNSSGAGAGGGGGWVGGPQGGGGAVPGEVAATAQALVEHVLSCCLQVFQATVHLLHALANAKAPKPSSGLELLLAQQQRWQQQQAALQQGPLSPGGAPGTPQPPAELAHQAQAQQQQQQQQQQQGAPAERARAESEAAWDALQSECEQLLGVVLGAQQALARRGGSKVEAQGEGWLAAAGALEPADRAAGGTAGAAGLPPDAPGGLTFSLAQEVQGLLPAASGPLAAGAAGGGAASLGGGQQGKGEKDMGQLVRQILGGHPGSAALVPGLYRPVLQFAEAAEQVLGTAAGAGGSGSGGGEGGMRQLSQLFSMPWRAASESAAERSRLRSFVESFVRLEFLPAVYVDFRARCTAVLEDPDAFRPRARLRTGSFQPSAVAAAGGSGGGAGGVGAGGSGGGGAGEAGGRPLLPAALATEGMVEELLGWAALMPPYATHLTGVVENVLGRVLDAFTARLAAAAGGSVAGRLAENVALVRLAAKEPSAALLGTPVAFFVGGNTDAMESFVSSVIASGFGANDESTERDLLAALMGERPLPPAALLSAGGDASRLLALAALSDSLEYVADVIRRCTSASASAAAAAGSVSGGGGGGAPPRLDGGSGGSSSGGGGGGGWQSRLMGWRGRGSLERGLTEGLAHLADRYRAAAGACMRVIRLDLLLLVVSSLSDLPRSSYVCGEEEAKEVDECIGALARSVGRLDEELSAYLPPAKRAYAFRSLAPAAAHVLVWLLPEIREVNHNGVARMCRMVASLQPALLGVGGSSGGTGAGASATSRPEAARLFDKAKLYYTLLTYSVEGLLATVAEKPHRFTPAEYAALLNAPVAERPPATPDQRAALQRLLAEAGAGGKGGGSGVGAGARGGGKGGGANAALAAFVKAVVPRQQ